MKTCQSCCRRPENICASEATAELIAFENNCKLQNTRQYSGIKRLQIECWLLFEDQTSSIWAKVDGTLH